MLSIHPGALIWNQSYIFFTQNYDERGKKVLNYVFSQKICQILVVFHVIFKGDG